VPELPPLAMGLFKSVSPGSRSEGFLWGVRSRHKGPTTTESNPKNARFWLDIIQLDLITSDGCLGYHLII
jgi:hypothetical protein